MTAPSSSDSVPVQEICVPSGYFQPWQGRRETITDLAITAKWPKMDSIWDKPLPGKYYDPVTHGDLLIIWFGLARSFPSIEFRFHVSARLLKIDQPGSPEYGLQHLVANATNHRPEAEFYFESTDIHSNYIECALPSYVKYPGCKAEFEYRGYLISVDYSHTLFPDWKQIQTQVEKLISSFEMNK